METKDLQPWIEIVEKAISLAGVDPTKTRSQDHPGQWNMKAGEHEIWVDLLEMEEDGKVYFQAMSPIVSQPQENREEFLHELLELNYMMVNIAFVVYKDGVYLRHIKEAQYIQVEEVASTLNLLGIYVMRFADKLMERFQAKELVHKEAGNNLHSH